MNENVKKVEIGTFLYQTGRSVEPTLFMGNFVTMNDGKTWFHPFNGMPPREVKWVEPEAKTGTEG